MDKKISDSNGTQGMIGDPIRSQTIEPIQAIALAIQKRTTLVKKAEYPPLANNIKEAQTKENAVPSAAQC